MAARVQSVVVGAGVRGLAVARSLARAGHEVLVLEASSAVGAPGVLRRLFMSYSVTVFWPLVHQVAISGHDAPKGAAEAVISLFQKAFGG